MPDDPDLPKTPKQWIINVCAVVIGDSFNEWVTKQVQERNAEMCAKKEMMIAMDPDMASAFNASTHVSRLYCISFYRMNLFIVYSVQRNIGQHDEDLE